MENHCTDGLTSITQLPEDCLIFIFKRLDCYSDRDSFGLTCHRWLHIQNISRQSLHFQCSFSHFGPSLSQNNLTINSFHLYRMLARFQHLQHLSLSGCTELPDSSLNQLHYFSSKLQSLYLDCCFGITDNGISMVSMGCSSLMVISLYRCNVTDVGLETLASGCLSLKNVNLSYCSLISDCGLKALFRGCRQLQALKISCCRNINGIGFRGCPASLAYIDAESCKLEPEGIEAMVSGGGLECFNVSGLSWTIHGDGLAALGTGLGSRVKVLNLRMCRTVGDESIMAIAKGCPLLQEWSLALCHEVRMSGWESIGSNCNSLEKLHVNRCRNLCNRGLQALRDGCKRLSVLYMSRCSKITHIAIEMFKCHRADVEIKEEEMMFIGPSWTPSSS